MHTIKGIRYDFCDVLNVLNNEHDPYLDESASLRTLLHEWNMQTMTLLYPFHDTRNIARCNSRKQLILDNREMIAV